VPATAERLAAALADLPVVIDDATCRSGTVAVPSFGGDRPTSTVTVTGADLSAEGEHVGWTADVHAAFGRAGARRAFLGRWRIGSLAHALRARGLPPYDRAAIETAAVELGLRQGATTLGALAGVTPRPPGWVVSFGRVPDPAAEAARHPGQRLKVDVDAAWPDAVWRALAATGRVAILDWKDSGDAAAYERALRWIPGALHEDPRPPWPAAVAERLSLDACVTEPSALGGRVPVACNLKPARMGSFLGAVRAAADCERRGIAIYVGGMFEVGVGRRQLRDLAGVLCPDGPNDLAPIPLAEAPSTP